MTRRFTGVFEERKCGGSLHCGFASGRDDGGGGWVRKRTDNGKDCWFGLCSSHPSRETKARWMGHPAPDSVEQSKINMTRGLDTVHLLV